MTRGDFLGDSIDLDADGRGRLIRDIHDLVLGPGQYGQYIATPPENVPFVLRPAHAAHRLWCRRLSNSTFIELVMGDYGRDICRPYLEEDQLPVPLDTDPPFTGGQCPGARYLVRGSYISQSSQNGCGTQREWVASNVEGPINGVDVVQGFWNVTTGGQFDGGVFDLLSQRRLGFSASCRSDGGNVTYGDNVVITSVERSDGGADDCGDPPSPPPGYGPAPNPAPNPPDTTPFNPGDGRPDVDITLGDFGVLENGEINIPVTIGDVEFNLGAPLNNPDTPYTPRVPDYSNPSSNNESSPPGGGDGEGDEPEQIDVTAPSAVVVVSITESPPRIAREVGGPEDVTYVGPTADYGWFRWKVNGGRSSIERIMNTQQVFIFSRGTCEEADGYEIKLSSGVRGFAVHFGCESDENN